MNTNACQDCPEHQHIPQGLLLQWHVTERCNLRCTHCYQESHGGAELDFEQLLGILAQFEELLARWRGTKNPHSPRGHITVTGGEPFVRRDFLELLEVFARRRQRFSFATGRTLRAEPAAARPSRSGSRQPRLRAVCVCAFVRWRVAMPFRRRPRRSVRRRPRLLAGAE